MLSDKVRFEMNLQDVEDVDSEGNYKSYFARSMAVNFAYRESRDNRDDTKCNNKQESHQPAPFQVNGVKQFPISINLQHPQQMHHQETPQVVRLRKDLRSQTWNTSSACNGSQGSSGSTASSSSSRRTSLCSNIRVGDSPVENLYLQSQVNTLQWQLKEAESSREMYRAVMRQVVTFLERAHRSLELLGSRIKATPNNSRLSRPQSEYFINTSADTLLNTTDLQWHWKKKFEPLLDEIPPEKLSQEAYRLLRTAQSLLNTHEPDLAHVSASNSIEEDISFLSSLAKEFPSTEANKLPQRATSFSLCPKLLTPDKTSSTTSSSEKYAKFEKFEKFVDKLQENTLRELENEQKAGKFSRKYSLQLNDTVRRNSFLREVSKKGERNEEKLSERSSVIAPGDIFSSTLIEDKRDKHMPKTCKFDKFSNYEKSNSPPVSSVGSAEDESGFSSMNSFQEVGIPHVDLQSSQSMQNLIPSNSTLRNSSKLELNCYEDFRNFALDKQVDDVSEFRQLATDLNEINGVNDIELWRSSSALHKRWSTTPVESGSHESCLVLTEKAPVLWV